MAQTKLVSTVVVGLVASRARSKKAIVAVRFGSAMGVFVFASRNTNSRRFGPQLISFAPVIRYGSTDGGLVGGPQPDGVPASGALGHELAAGDPAAAEPAPGVAAPGVAEPAGALMVALPHAPAIMTTTTRGTANV